MTTLTTYRDALPQLAGTFMLTEGGLETTLVFHDRVDLPCFASFPVLESPVGRALLRRINRDFIEIAREKRTGLVLITNTWRASRDWGKELGYSPEDIRRINAEAVEFLVETRETECEGVDPVVITGCVGPRRDAYEADTRMTAEEARWYHGEQIGVFAGTQADLVSAFTLTNINEAIGIALAGQDCNIPVAISFTLETNGKLPTGESIGHAIERVDEETGGSPAYYMINCAHPTHFAEHLDEGAAWMERIVGIHANASCMSHEELDSCEVLDDGDPGDLAKRLVELKQRFPHIAILGGCCGTDHRHIAAIGEAMGA